MAEAGAIVLLAGAAYVMSMKDKLSPTEKAEREANEKDKNKIKAGSCPWEKEMKEKQKSQRIFSISKDPQYRRN